MDPLYGEILVSVSSEHPGTRTFYDKQCTEMDLLYDEIFVRDSPDCSVA